MLALVEPSRCAAWHRPRVSPGTASRLAWGLRSWPCGCAGPTWSARPGPGRPGRAWLITVLATGWSLLVTACLLWPGLGTAVPDASLPAGFEGQRLQFELLVLAPLAAVVAACTVFHVTSRRRA
jgi:hypothetical protein